MVETKMPKGAIALSLVESIFFNVKKHKYYLFDTCHNRIEISDTVFEELKMKGVKELV